MNKNGKIIEIFSNNKWVIYIMAFLIGSAMGIIIPLTSTHMSKNNVSNALIGVIASVYFFTIAFGTIFINKKMQNKDLKKLISLGLFVSSICTIAFPIVSNRIVWFALMTLMGLGVSFHLVGTQTALHRFSNDNIRGIVSGVYTLFFALGFASGTIGGPKMYESNIVLPFTVGAACLLIAAFMMYLKIKDKLTINMHSDKKIINKVSLSLQGAFSYGFIENTIASLYPLFLLQNHFSLSQMGYALGMFVLGGMSGTLPIAYIGDKIGREKGLIISVIISVLAIIGIIQFNNFTNKLIFSFIAGIGVGAIYPVSLALAAQGLDSEEIISATSMFTFFYGFGSGAGPLLSSLVMDRLGKNYLFSLSLVLLITLLPHLLRKAKVSSNYDFVK